MKAQVNSIQDGFLTLHVCFDNGTDVSEAELEKLSASVIDCINAQTIEEPATPVPTEGENTGPGELFDSTETTTSDDSETSVEGDPSDDELKDIP
jgi:hypothetical protein|tara:strand:- start:247 stop:531 length:285 start_codon:yes stop_codon:yes gene_type:complete